MISLAALSLACGSSDDSPGGGASGPIVNLVADNDRSGTLDHASDPEEAQEEAWSASNGAMFLVNLDDDDEDGVADNQDEIVNGGADELDLGQLHVAPWPDAPAEAVTTLEIDPESSAKIRIFRRGASGWTLVSLTGPVAFTYEELRAGVELGIEGLDFVRKASDPWQGLVQAKLTVTKGSEVVGEDVVQMRLAPWIMNHNLRPFDTVYFSDFSSVFVSTMSAAVEEAGLSPQIYPDNYTTGTQDIWYEDWFQTGWTAIAGPAGVHAMMVFNPRPWGRDKNPDHLPLTFLRKRLLGPDKAVAVLFDEAKELHSGSTYDSHGNHEALPPYPEAPVGRLLLGSGIKQTTRDFYAAQQVQPPIYLDTSWLMVGHMDEVYGAVRAATPRGFKMIQNTPALCKQLFEKWNAEGHGAAVLFESKIDYGTNWQTTLAEVLADATMMTWNQEAQANVDLMHADLVEEAGLTEDDFVEVPVLYEEIDGGKIAWLPDTANIRVIGEGDVTVFAKTFGPVSGGEDLFAKDLLARLTDPARSLGSEGKGLQVKFADSWSYHVLNGDVHCASNFSALPTASEPRWWEGVK